MMRTPDKGSPQTRLDLLGRSAKNGNLHLRENRSIFSHHFLKHPHQSKKEVRLCAVIHLHSDHLAMRADQTLQLDIMYIVRNYFRPQRLVNG